MGVNFFFVLSEFIMIYLHFDDIGSGWDKAIIFFKKRIMRVLPLYWILTFSLLSLIYFISSILTPYMLELEFIIKSLFLIPQKHNFNLHVAWILVQKFLFYSVFFIVVFNKKFGLIVASSLNQLLNNWSKKRDILLLLGNVLFSICLLYYIFISFFMKFFQYIHLDGFFSISLIFILVAILAVIPGMFLYNYIKIRSCQCIEF